MRRATRAAAAAAAAAVFLVCARAQNDREGAFGPINELPIAPVQGAVSGDGTTVYTSSQAGEIYLVDIKSNRGTWLNRGGDGQTIADMCIDSREDKTLYGPGRDSGLLFAFTAEGKLVRRFALTDAAGHYISSCIQSRFFLYVADALDNTMYRFDLPDTGPDRGKPPPLADGKRDGEAIAIGGDWEPAPEGQLGLMSLEWSRLWNETGWALNSANGNLYTFPLNAQGQEAEMSRVWIDGKQKAFPGAVKLLIDSSNERIMYIAQPARNAVAVVEVNEKRPNAAKYIRTITSPLINGPVGLAEYGEWLYVLNADLGAEDRNKANSRLVQLPKHIQVLAEDHDEDEPFTFVGDGEDPPQEEVHDTDEVIDVMTEPAREIGKAPVAPEDEKRTPDTVDKREKPVVEDEEKEQEEEGGGEDSFEAEGDGDPQVGGDGNTFDTVVADSGGSCFPGDAEVTLECGTARRMDELSVGDRVLVAPGIYSPVIMFTHKDASAAPVVARIHIDGADVPLSVTPSHYLYANGELVAASAVRVGDVLRLGSGSTARVSHVTRAIASGLYNPQTLHGDVVVNGVVASTYTRAVDPRVATVMLSPVRAAAALLGGRWDALVGRLRLMEGGSPLAVTFAPRGPARVGV